MKGRLLARAALTPRHRAEMHALMCAHFDGVSEQRFAADLEDKNWVVLLEDDDGVLHGFSTLRFYRARIGEEELDVVCSGDTIVEPAYWTSPALSASWISSVLRLHRARGGGGRLLWLLICSGPRSYRFLPVFMREFHPRSEQPTPADVAVQLHALARERFGTAYQQERGLVLFAEPQRLRAELAHVPEGRQQNPHVAFFLQRNPEYRRGDELVCLCELSRANLTRAGLRMLALGDRSCDSSAAERDGTR